MAQLVSGGDWRREAVVAFTLSNWVTIVVKITNPRL